MTQKARARNGTTDARAVAAAFCAPGAVCGFWMATRYV